MTREAREFLFGAAAIVAAVWAVWFQTGGFEYILLDDNLYVWENEHVAGGFGWASFAGVCRDLTQGGIWMPFTSLTYMLDISLFGAGPGPLHLASVAWHSVNAVLVFYLIYALTGRRSPFAAFVAAAFWALHPQRCESVAWIASRKDLTFTFWTLVGLIAWRRQTAARVALAYLCMALGCLSKPTAMVFPALAFCVEWTVRGRGVFLRPFRQALRYAPFVLMAAATGALAAYSQTHVPGAETRGLVEGYGTFAWRSLNAAVSLGLYFLQLVCPYGVHIVYRPNTDGVPFGAAAGLLALAAAAGALVWAYRTKRGGVLLWASALWFLAAIGPTLGVAGGFGYHARADRFLYLPTVAVSVVLAAGLVRAGAGRWWRAACLAGVAAYAVAAAVNARSYRNDYTLFSRVCAFDGEHPIALQRVGMELCTRFGDPDGGIAAFRRALASNPSDQVTAGQLCYTLARRGRAEDEAEILDLCEPLRREPALDEKGLATEALGIVMMRRRKWDDAIRYFTASLDAAKRRHAADETMVQLAMCHYNKGEVARAEELFEDLVALGTVASVRERAAQALATIRSRREAGR